PLPEALALAAARCLPWLELTCGACLLLGQAVREATLIVLVLLLLFLVDSLISPPEVDCGCFLFPLPALARPSVWIPVRTVFVLRCALCGIRKTYGERREEVYP